MKHFIVLALIFVFSVSTVAPAAFAFDCPMMKSSTVKKNDAAADNPMPCHGSQTPSQDQPVQKSGHCKGLCLCLHLSVNQAQLLHDSYSFHAVTQPQSVYALSDVSAPSIQQNPLLRPPITLS